MKIYLAIDHNCYSPVKAAEGRLGGTERFFLIVRKWLAEAGHNVSINPEPGEDIFDVAIHSNVFNPKVRANRHICWAGSTHTDADKYPYDLVIVNSQDFKNTLRLDNAVVLPACIEDRVVSYRTDTFVKNRIFCNSNPNRYLEHAINISHILEQQNIDFEWHFCGGNKLYSDSFGECFSTSLPSSMHYHGVLNRHDMLNLMASSHAYVYPNLSDESETQCVAAIESAALGMPVIVPNRAPFTDTLAGLAIFAEDIDSFVCWVLYLMKTETRINPDVTRYRETTVIPKLLKLIDEVCNG